jgi:hypothetical protein
VIVAVLCDDDSKKFLNATLSFSNLLNDFVRENINHGEGCHHHLFKPELQPLAPFHFGGSGISKYVRCLKIGPYSLKIAQGWAHCPA